MARSVIRHGILVLPDELKKADLVVDNGKIMAIGADLAPMPGDQLIDARGKYVLPGFIDIHNHGAAGFDFSFGQYDTETKTFNDEASTFQQSLDKALSFYRRNGITRVFLTTMAAPLESLLFSMEQVRKYIEEDKHAYAALIGGINVEGTFLKMPEYAGAQNPAWFYPPDPAIIDRFQHASGNRIRIVNVPPEHGEAGLELIRHLRSLGITVAGGHSGATAEEFDRAIAAGLSLAVHFLNGPSRSSSKSFHGGGAVEAMLRTDEIALELILDGYHIHPAYVQDTLARKGTDRCLLISDSMFVNGLTGVKAFELGGLKGTVSANEAYLQVAGKEDVLFGSVLTPVRGLANLLRWLTLTTEGVWYREHPALDFETALVTASAMASGNPARQIGIFEPAGEDPGTGSIEPGKWADLVIADIRKAENHYQVKVEQVFVQGTPMTDLV